MPRCSDPGGASSGGSSLRDVMLPGRHRRCRNATVEGEASRDLGTHAGALPVLGQWDEGVYPAIEISRGTTGGPRTRSTRNRSALANMSHLNFYSKNRNLLGQEDITQDNKADRQSQTCQQCMTLLMELFTKVNPIRIFLQACS